MSYTANGNKAGKSLATRPRGHRQKTKILYIIHPENQSKLYHPQAIADAFSTYYGSHYNLKQDPHTIQLTSSMITKFLDKIKLPQLTEEQLGTLNSPLTALEVSQTIDSLPNNKSPGPDGFTGDYFKTFRNILAPNLTEIYNHAASSSFFPSEMLQAMIVALPKPGKEPHTPQNFHPISLLNNDLQIYAKLIAGRLVDLLPSLIHPDQSGFTNGHQTADATRRLINIIHLANKTRTPSLLLALEAEKVFDRIHWEYLVQVINGFGFKGQIFQAIMSLYTNIE